MSKPDQEHRSGLTQRGDHRRHLRRGLRRGERRGRLLGAAELPLFPTHFHRRQSVRRRRRGRLRRRGRQRGRGRHHVGHSQRPLRDPDGAAAPGEGRAPRGRGAYHDRRVDRRSALPRTARRGGDARRLLDHRSGVFVFWNIFTLLGALGAKALGNPASWGLDAAVPAAFLGLLWPRLQSNYLRVVAATSMAFAMVDHAVAAGRTADHRDHRGRRRTGMAASDEFGGDVDRVRSDVRAVLHDQAARLPGPGTVVGATPDCSASTHLYRSRC